MIYLRVACFAASNCDYRNVLEAYGRAGDALLKPHGMALHDRWGPGPLMADEIEWNDYVIDSQGGPGDLRALCHRKWPDGKGVPVILCNRGTRAPYGETIETGNTEANGGVRWLPYVLINAQALNPAGSTLIHEMIHTTGLGDRDHDKDPSSVFYSADRKAGDGVRKLAKKHADRLRRMYYAEAG
ncbi:MAG: hypothetical protein AB7K86_21120 [Rhodospirillales bacterium]